MENKKYNFTVKEKNYSVELIDYGFVDPLNTSFYLNFRISSSQLKKNLYLKLGITDQALGLWGLDPNRTQDTEKLVTLGLQIMPKMISNTRDERLSVMFHRDDNIARKDGVFYFKASKSLEETSKIAVFSVEIPTNAEIRRKILEVCHSHWQTDPHGFVMKQELENFVPVSDTELERNLRYLEEGDFIKASLSTAGYEAVRITKYGIDIFEDPNEFNRLFSIKLEQQAVNIGGDVISTIIVGDNNIANIKSQIADAFKVIQTETNKVEVENKEELEKLIIELRKELESEGAKVSKVKLILASIAKISSVIHNKILSNPIIAPIIAKILLDLGGNVIK